MRILVSGATATMRRYLDNPYLGHLLVPAAGNSLRSILASGLPWAADNAAFTGFDPASFAALLGRIAGKPGCLFVACPDVVGDAEATLKQFEVWQPVLRQMGFPVALVGQDGLEYLPMPWNRFQAFFIGGSTEWKLSQAAADLAREAKRRGAWVHMGRCNTRRRLRHASAIGCDSVDGTAFSRWPGHSIPQALGWLAEIHGLSRPGPNAAKPKTDHALPLARQTADAMLGLPGWIVDQSHRLRSEYRFCVRYLPEPASCIYCGADRLLARGLRRHGLRQQAIRDLPRQGKRMVLLVSRIRFRCLACGRTFLQPLPDVFPGRSMTVRLVEYTREQVAGRSCSSLSREIGVDEKTIRNVVTAAAVSYQTQDF